MITNALGFDFESHLIGPDLCQCGEIHNQFPPAVCMSWCLPNGDSDVVKPAEGIAILKEALAAGMHLVGAETAFDVLLACVNNEDPDGFDGLLATFVEAYEAGRIHDVCLRQKLLDLAAGSYRWITHSDGRRLRIGYDLATTAKRATGRVLEKPSKETKDTHPRLRYALLDGIPIADWPAADIRLGMSCSSTEYAREDSVAAIETFLAQENWRESAQGQKILDIWQGRECAAFTGTLDPLGDERAQTCHALWLKAMSGEGLVIDPVALAAFEKRVRKEYIALCAEVRTYRAALDGDPKSAPLLRREYWRDLKRLRELKHPYRDNKLWKALKEELDHDLPEALEIWGELLKAGLVRWVYKKGMNAARARMFSVCLLKHKPIPHTDKFDPERDAFNEKIAIDSDSCRLSEDAGLIAYAELTHAGKMLTGDIPQLKKGVDRPIHTHYEVLLETGRISSAGPNVTNRARGEGKEVKQRDGTTRPGHAGDRECFATRPGNVLIDCLAPGTRILKADLTWTKIEELHVGEELIGFDETIARNDTKFRGSTVEHVSRSQHPCYRIKTTRGEVVASDSHLWVARKAIMRYKNANCKHWIRSDALEVGDTISFFAEPWEVEHTEESGYLAGFFDGEGDTARGGVGFGQNPGPVLDYVLALLEARGYDMRDTVKSRLCRNPRISGGAAEACRFLGSIRPKRLLAKSRCHWEDAQTWGKRSTPAKILSIEFLGMQETVSVKTSTRTLVAEGFLSHNCDYPQLELYALAQCCRWVLGYSTLGDVLTSFDAEGKGMDPHTAFAALIAGGIPYEEAKARKDRKQLPERDAAKGCNFGRPGGLGAETMVSYAAKSYGVVRSQNQWEELFKLWDQQWPEMPEYFEYINKLECEDGKFAIVTPATGLLRAGAKYCAACNHNYQALGAAVAKRAGWYVFKACYVPGVDAELFGCMPVNFIHDQLLVEAPKERAAAAAKRVEYWMGRAAIELMPDYGPTMAANTEAILCARYSKMAEKVVGADGALEVWEDKRLLLDCGFDDAPEEADEENEESAAT